MFNTPERRDDMDELVEELVLELTDLSFHEHDGLSRASAHARLIYEPATPGQPHVHSAHSWRFIAPIGPLDVDELRWYVEDYATWPGNYFRNRARNVEENLVKWGQVIYDAAMPVAGYLFKAPNQCVSVAASVDISEPHVVLGVVAEMNLLMFRPS